jgi:hypothetical protein
MMTQVREILWKLIKQGMDDDDVDQAKAELAKAVREKECPDVHDYAWESGYDQAIEDIAKWIEGE